jgi:hypothetical protein
MSHSHTTGRLRSLPVSFIASKPARSVGTEVCIAPEKKSVVNQWLTTAADDTNYRVAHYLDARHLQLQP